VPVITAGQGVAQAFTTTLTNAQILATPTTTGIQLVAAPGSGHTLIPLAVLLAKSFTAGAYTNIDPTAKLFVGYGPATPTASYAATNTVGLIDEAGFTFFGAADFETFNMPTGAIEDGNGGGGVFPPSGADLRNLALTICSTNGALGNFTGGNAANTLAVTVVYAVA